jgi:3'(2'), 5'-bisphosphate nucleotidase
MPYDIRVSDDDTLARTLATDAGALLLQLRAETGPDADPKSLRAAGDARSHELLTAALARHRPADAVLSEEGKEDRRRLSADRVWIIDPLDGTREFGEPERTDWAVHVALWQRGELAAGAVALPGLGVTFGTDEPPALAPPVAGPTRLLVSRTRPPDFAVRLAELVESELVPLGSAGAKAMAVVRGDADAYAHAGGQYEWDSAAPVAVALAAGLHASRVDGTPLRYNAADVYQPDLLICRPELAEPLLAAIARLGSA